MLNRKSIMAGLALALAVSLGAGSAEAKPNRTPVVYAVVEGQESDTGRPTLVLTGAQLTTPTEFTITRTSDSTDMGTITRRLRSKSVLVLELPDSVKTDTANAYTLRLFYRQGNVAVPVTVARGKAAAASVTLNAMTPETVADLGDADSLDGQDGTYYLRLENATGVLDPSHITAVPWSSLTNVPADIADGDANTAYTAGAGLTLTGNTFSRNPISFSELTNVPAGLADGDDGATYVAGSGLTLTGNTFSRNPIAFSELTNVPAGLADGDNDTTYSAGAGLTLTGTTFSRNPVAFSELTNVPAGLADGDDNTTYSAGNGITLTGTTFSIDFTPADARYLRLSGGTMTGALTVSTTGTAISGTSSSSTGTGVFGSATSTTGANFGVLGRSASTLGIGVFGDATATSGLNYGGYFQTAGNQGAGVYASGPRGIDARASGSGSSPCAVNAYTPSGTGNSFGVYSENASAGGIGVYARASSSTGSSYALYAEADSSSSAAVYAFQTQDGGNALIANLNSSSTPSSSANNIAVFQNNGSNRARIDRNGNMILNGTLTQNGSADFAERVRVTGSPRSMEPGDVIVIDPAAPRSFTVSTTPDSPLVAGIYSTKPAMLAGLSNADDDAWKKEEIPMAMTGIVPVKVCNEGGAIRIGDLLVTSSVRGHAKRAPANPAPGTIVGKALGSMNDRAGVVELLLMSR